MCRPTTHETSKRTRTIHLRIATFSSQIGLWRSTHPGFPSYEHQTWNIDASGAAMLQYPLACNHEFLFRRNFRNLFLVKIQVGSDSFRGHTPEPVIQRNIDKLIGLEHFQKYAIGRAGVFDGMGRNPGNKADIVGIEVHGSSFTLIHGYG